MIAYRHYCKKFKDMPILKLLQEEHINTFATAMPDFLPQLAEKFEALESLCNLIYYRDYLMSYEKGDARLDEIPEVYVPGIIELCEYHHDELMVINTLNISKNIYSPSKPFLVGIYPTTHEHWHQELPMLIRKHTIDNLLKQL